MCKLYFQLSCGNTPREWRKPGNPDRWPPHKYPRTGMVLVRIKKIKLPYHTKYNPVSGSVDTLNTLSGIVVLVTNLWMLSYYYFGVLVSNSSMINNHWNGQVRCYSNSFQHGHILIDFMMHNLVTKFIQLRNTDWTCTWNPEHWTNTFPKLRTYPVNIM